MDVKQAKFFKSNRVIDLPLRKQLVTITHTASVFAWNADVDQPCPVFNREWLQISGKSVHKEYSVIPRYYNSVGFLRYISSGIDAYKTDPSSNAASYKPQAAFSQRSFFRHLISVYSTREKEANFGRYSFNIMPKAKKMDIGATDQFAVKLSKDTKNVHICVIDYKIGINRKYLPQIFNRFYHIPRVEEVVFSNQTVNKRPGKVWGQRVKNKEANLKF